MRRIFVLILAFSLPSSSGARGRRDGIDHMHSVHCACAIQMGGLGRSRAKHRSGGRRVGAGAKKQADLRGLHELIDARVDEKDWSSIIAALVKKARRGDVQAFRELRTCRFGSLPETSQYIRPAEEKTDGDLFDLANFVDIGLPGAQPDTDEETG